ncbi:MAG: SpoIID/LytB domain-containing protein [Bdellovibrionales bacterium]|nr:SpoIID/LytB domain-containing protein [Bdellovibrionales bacterium]
MISLIRQVASLLILSAAFAPLFSEAQSPFSPDRMQACHNDYLEKDAPSPMEMSCQNIRVKIFPVRSKPRYDHYPLAMDPAKDPKLGQEIEFLNEEGFTLKRFPDGQLFSPKEKIQRVAIRFENGQLWIKTWSPAAEDLKENTPLKFEPFWIVPKKGDEPTVVNWKGPNKRGAPIDIDMIYRGAFAVRTLLPNGPGERARATDKPYLTVINHLPLEEYLYATVSSEMRLDFHLEALKAQAVGARTFALRAILPARYDRELARPLIPKEPEEWDVLPTTMFQQYLGVGKENPRSIQAVNGTKYQYVAAIDPLWKVRAPIEAMYSDTSGGFTCFPADCMGGSLVRPIHLSPVVDAPGTDQPQYFGRTTVSVSPQRVQQILTQMKLKLGRVTALSEVPETRKSQRVQQIRVETENNGYLNLSSADSLRLASNLGFRTRLLLSQSQIQSKTLWRVDFPDALTVVPVYVYGGLGHPIGMSQWGAAIFAQSYGYPYTKILTHYYTGVQILRLNQRF